MNKNFMKFAFASALAFAGTLSVNAQITAPEWAVDQNATIQHLGVNMQEGDRFFTNDDILLCEITSTEATTHFTYQAKVVGVNDLKVAELTELIIPFGVWNDPLNVSARIASVDPIAAYDPSADKTPLSTDLSGIKTLYVGYHELAEDHLSTTGDEITSVADGAFAAMTGITEVISYCTTPPTMTAAAFPSARYGSAKLSVAPSNNGTVAGKFANAVGWEKFKRLYTVGDACCFGDFNSSTQPNVDDVTELAKYVNARNKQTFINSCGYTVNTHSLDINGNGSVNIDDVTALAKMISGRKRAK